MDVIIYVATVYKEHIKEFGGRYALEMSRGQFGGESWHIRDVPTWSMCNST